MTTTATVVGDVSIAAGGEHRKSQLSAYVTKRKNGAVRLSAGPTTAPTTVSSSPRFSIFLSAGTAAAVSCALYNPLDCLRVRWHVSTQQQGSSMTLFAREILQKEGLIDGLWRPGLGANVMGMALSAALRFGYYESVRDFLVHTTSQNTSHDQKGGSHMIVAGMLCGSAAYVVTTPFHLIKTMIQAEQSVLSSNGRYVSGSRAGREPFATNLHSTWMRLWQEEGMLSLYKGALPLTFRGGLFTAGQMLGYDGLKTIAKQHGVEDGTPLHFVASLSASFFASFMSAPADMVMTKYMSSSDTLIQRQSVADCIGRIYLEGGLRGFWKGWLISFVRLTPVMLTNSIIYEQLRHALGIGFMT